MSIKRIAMVLIALSILVIPSIGHCEGDNYNRVLYKEDIVYTPNGMEVSALINRLTGRVAYVWLGNGWDSANAKNFQVMYEKRRTIRAMVSSRRLMD